MKWTKIKVPDLSLTKIKLVFVLALGSKALSLPSTSSEMRVLFASKLISLLWKSFFSLLTIFLVLLTKILCTLHVFKNIPPKPSVNPMQAIQVENWLQETNANLIITREVTSHCGVRRRIMHENLHMVSHWESSKREKWAVGAQSCTNSNHSDTLPFKPCYCCFRNYSGKLSLVNDTHPTLNNHLGARTYKVTINAEKNPRYVDENRTDHNDVVHSRAWHLDESEIKLFCLIIFYLQRCFVVPHSSSSLKE